MQLIRILSLLLILLFFPNVGWSYTTWQTSLGTLKCYFGQPDAKPTEPTDMAVLTELDQPFPIPITFENSGDKALELNLAFRTIETIEFVDADPIALDSLSRQVVLKAGETQTIQVEVIAREGTYRAHYPIRLNIEVENQTQSQSTELTLVLETRLDPPGPKHHPMVGRLVDHARELPLNDLTDQVGLAFSSLDTYRVYWNFDQGDRVDLPVAFTGSVDSGANFWRGNIVCDGIGRSSIVMHPPYKGSVGNVGAEYRIQLPEKGPLSLGFYSALRQVKAPETPSDGVTYRVFVDDKEIFQQHHASTSWVENRISLDDFAGREILLRLESDPGPKRNTNCDSCYWGDLILFCGEIPQLISPEEKQQLYSENLRAVQTGRSDISRTKVYPLQDGLRAAVTFGHYGFLDGIIGLGNDQKQVQFEGVHVFIRNQRIGSGPVAFRYGPWVSKDDEATGRPPKPEARLRSGKARRAAQSFRSEFEQHWAQQIEWESGSETLFFSLSVEGPALRLSVEGPETEMIERIEFGPATLTANRVYYGHGYCIEKPERFVAGAGGHNLATSHVGIDFENGISVLQGSTCPVDRFVVEPEHKRYTLATHPSTTLTLLPGLNGALDCAVKYRPILKNRPSSGVAEKAGRFVFDIWGGNYADHLKLIQQAVRYGLNDALFLVHSWQHWGYDNRLPDIWPPNPHLGWLAEMKEALKWCNENGIQYGIHDNYIDFYPDADEFNYDVTSFDRNGQPRKAWCNHGINAQSYQFRPDRLQDFLTRNLDLILEELPLSSYFVDVFTSLPPIDYYDREGHFHSRLESQRAWNFAFDTIRDRLSKENSSFRSATTVSEAGMDSLIGHLDGADCQFLMLSPDSGEHRIHLRCENWSRIPWFDAVHHTAFSLHGVGYDGRYQAHRGRELHGIVSDDYLSAEILTGHALMVDYHAAGRDAVRKYWLAQELIRHLADKEIEQVQFDDNNIKRLRIQWNDGTIVYVNRSQTDWQPEGCPYLIPQFGYYAEFLTDTMEPFKGRSGIVRKDGRVIEISRREELRSGLVTQYLNTRQSTITDLTPLQPELNRFEYLGENRFSADFKWNVRGKVEKELCVFVHIVQKRMNWHQKLAEAVLGGAYPETPCTQWKDEIATDNHATRDNQGRPVMTIPDHLPAGTYELVVGLYDAKGDSKRARLYGQGFNRRYVVATVRIERHPDSASSELAGKVKEIVAEKTSWEDAELLERLLPAEKTVQVDGLSLKGALRVDYDFKNKNAFLTPLPDEQEQEVALELPGKLIEVQSMGSDGEVSAQIETQTGPNNLIRFTTRKDDFMYVVTWE